MSTLFAPRAGTVHQTAHALHWLSRMRSPLEAWSGRSRLLVGLLIGAVVFAVGANGWISADLAGVQASRVALSDAEHRVAQAQQALAQLPALRRQAAATATATATANAQAPATWTPADDMRLMSLLAVRSGVTLLTLAPGVGRNAGSDTVRSLHLTVQADFLHLMIFLRGLSDMPILVVPEDVNVKRSTGGLLISATLHVFADLSPVAASPELFIDEDLDADDEDVVFYDPFSRESQADGDATDVGLLRLAGLLRDRTRGLALLETADGAATVEQGQRVGNDRVTGMDALSITLTNAVGSRTLTLTEAS
jgi:Tfp pilus assembly protein PilO